MSERKSVMKKCAMGRDDDSERKPVLVKLIMDA